MNPLFAALAGVALVLAAAAVWLWLRRSGDHAAPAQVTRRAAAPTPHVAPRAALRPAAAPVAAAAVAAVTPPELAAFSRLRAQDLAPERQAAFVKVFRDVPRPPRLLQHLMSPEFLNAANSAQLVELISAEPVIAAKVLSAVNSPLYALKAPVRSAGQAVTYLGLNSVRSLCLQYILISAFKADTPERKQALDAIWRATALAGELAHQLSYRLNLPEPGTTVSAVVLSFLGRLATAATMPQGVLAKVPARDFLQRSVAEQETLGLCAGEIGRLLMRDWGLPENIIADAADIDAMLVTPAGGFETSRNARLALGYLCARLAEQLACGERSELLSFTLQNSSEAELHHLKGALGDARLARLADFVCEPGLSGEVQRMLAALSRR
jgi:HD-like signal output (HDOD) protein